MAVTAEVAGQSGLGAAASGGAPVRAYLSGERGASVAVTLITLAAFGLRLSQMDQSLFGDEIFSYHDIAHRSLGGMLAAIHPPEENAPPLFFLLAWFSAQLGDPTIWIRVPSLILSTATIPLVYLLGRRTLGRTAGVLGAGLLAAMPFTNYYAIEARPYASVACFVTLAALALLMAVETRRRVWWVVYVLAAAAAVYSHYTGVFALLALAAWSVWACRGELKATVLAHAAVCLLYLPWLPRIHSKELGVIGTLEPLGVKHVLLDPLHVLAGHPYAGLSAIPTIPGLAVIGVALAIGLLALWRWPSQAGHHHLRLMAALALATPLGVLLYSLVSTDIWDPRDLYASAPAAALLFAFVVLAIPRRLALLAVVLIVAVLLIGTIRTLSGAYARPGYRLAARYLDRVAGPRDPILVTIWGLGLDAALPAQLERPHRVITGLPRQWPVPPPGGLLYIVIDNGLLKALRVSTPQASGFQLVGRRSYGGLVTFTLFTYRRQPA